MKKIIATALLFMLGSSFALASNSTATKMSDSQMKCHECMQKNNGDKTKCVDDCKEMKEEGKSMACGAGKCGGSMSGKPAEAKCGGTMKSN